jgi:hypothetical protein
VAIYSERRRGKGRRKSEESDEEKTVWSVEVAEVASICEHLRVSAVIRDVNLAHALPRKHK